MKPDKLKQQEQAIAAALRGEGLAPISVGPSADADAEKLPQEATPDVTQVDPPTQPTPVEKTETPVPRPPPYVPEPTHKVRLSILGIGGFDVMVRDTVVTDLAIGLLLPAAGPSMDITPGSSLDVVIREKTYPVLYLGGLFSFQEGGVRVLSFMRKDTNP
jgi:hypothetical protein